MNVNFEEFKSLAAKGNIIPVYKEIMGDMETPVSALVKLNRSPLFLLESVLGGEKWARYSFLGINPSMTIICHGRKVEIKHNLANSLKYSGIKNGVFEAADPLSAVKDILSLFKPVHIDGLPRFYGGFVGYVGYDVVKAFERVPDLPKDGVDMPDVFLMLADTILIFDNLKQTIKIVTNVHTEEKNPAEAYREAEERISAVVYDLKKTGSRSVEFRGFDPDLQNSYLMPEKFISNFKKEDFLNAVSKTKQYIKAGDIFQLVLSQRFGMKSDANPIDIYRALRMINPSPYMYFLDTGEAQLVGSSPEILVRLEDGEINLRPIAGTRRRGNTETEDIALEDELKKDPKEVAEHIMLVDLGRNDVGKVSEAGKVRVTELMSVERYSHVMHIVSNVEGDLKKGLDAFDVFRSCFPAGTVSGAPKIRAMEIIEELEPTKRGPYAGAVGYFSYSGNMDTCITIRTLLVKDGMIYVQAGAGIVADSVPESEYKETVNKAMAMMKAVELADNME
jgi:anthranilate synthase component 1